MTHSHRHPPLSVEPVEDRVLPSLSVGFVPSSGPGYDPGDRAEEVRNNDRGEDGDDRDEEDRGGDEDRGKNGRRDDDREEDDDRVRLDRRGSNRDDPGRSDERSRRGREKDDDDDGPRPRRDRDDRPVIRAGAHEGSFPSASAVEHRLQVQVQEPLGQEPPGQEPPGTERGGDASRYDEPRSEALRSEEPRSEDPAAPAPASSEQISADVGRSVPAVPDAGSPTAPSQVLHGTAVAEVRSDAGGVMFTLAAEQTLAAVAVSEAGVVRREVNPAPASTEGRSSLSMSEPSAIGPAADGRDEAAESTGETPPVESDQAMPQVSFSQAIEDAVEVLLPQVAPLTGAVALDVAAIEASAGELLSALAGVDLTAADEWADPERWAWVAAVVLVVGGAAYGARVQRARQAADRVTLGTDSVLARREGRDAPRPA